MLDSTDGTGDADGPFTSKRAGAVPAADIIKMCFSGKYNTPSEVTNILKGKSGLQGYLGTGDLRAVEKRIAQGDDEAEVVFKALGYQISKEIASFYATMYGRVDAIVFTGGMAHSHKLVNLIASRIGNMAKVFVYPGEMENESLALGALRVMMGEEEAAVYNVEDEIKNAFSQK
jgi:butyrate kinase